MRQLVTGHVEHLTQKNHQPTNPMKFDQFDLFDQI